MSTYQLSIITPNGKVFDGQVESIVATGMDGSLGVLAGHTPLVVALKNGPLKVKTPTAEKFYAVSKGILEVGRQNHVFILSDYATEKDTLEEANRYTS